VINIALFNFEKIDYSYKDFFKIVDYYFKR